MKVNRKWIFDNHGLTHNDFVRLDDHANPTAMKAIPESEVTTLVGTVDAIRRSIHRNHSDSLSLTMKVANSNEQVTLSLITVKFNAHNHNLAGGIFDLRTLRRDH